MAHSRGHQAPALSSVPTGLFEAAGPRPPGRSVRPGGGFQRAAIRARIGMLAAVLLVALAAPGTLAADLADLNLDGAVNRADIAVLEGCHTGPGVPLPAGSACAISDLDTDGDVDMVDFAILQRGLTAGSAAPGTPQIEIILESLQPLEAFVGQQFTLLLTVRNVGDAPATALTVDVTLPEIVQFVSSTPLAAAMQGQGLSVTVGDLAAGASVATTLIVKGVAAGQALPSASVTSPGSGAPLRVDASAALEIQNQYLEIVSTTTPLPLPCGVGVVSPLLGCVGLLIMAAQSRGALRRRSRRRAA